MQIKKSKSAPVKRKQNAQSGSRKRSKKTIVINSDTEDDDKDNKENKTSSKLDELEYEERVLALKEREICLREREANVRVMELANLEKEHKLKLDNN